jgi:hypothetical protein
MDMNCPVVPFLLPVLPWIAAATNRRGTRLPHVFNHSGDGIATSQLAQHFTQDQGRFGKNIRTHCRTVEVWGEWGLWDSDLLSMRGGNDSLPIFAEMTSIFSRAQ